MMNYDDSGSDTGANVSPFSIDDDIPITVVTFDPEPPTFKNRVLKSRAFFITTFSLLAVFGLFLLGLLVLIAFPLDGGPTKQYNDLDPVIILISIDGFAWSYYQNKSRAALCPSIQKLGKEGVSGPMKPIFSSVTFPNHFSLVTGLYAESHGIIANTMYDPDRDEHFDIWNSEQAQKPFWWDATPLWVTARENGVPSACMFWPGADVSTQKPTYNVPFNSSIPYSDRVDQVLSWLDDEDNRPYFITMYFEGVDHMAHGNGPQSPEVDLEIVRVDEAISQLVKGLEERTFLRNANIIIVSDHGMGPISEDKVIYLSDYTDANDIWLTTYYPVAGIYPNEGTDINKVAKDLKGKNPNMQVYLRDEIPEEYHYSNNDRIPPLIAVAEIGWITWPSRDIPLDGLKGAHGYNNSLPEITATFLANGPSFVRNTEIPIFQNLDLYGLMADILSLPQLPNNGSTQHLKDILA